MIIRYAEIEEIADKFDLYHEDNNGDTITVVEDEGEIVAFMQSTGSTIYFIESRVAGKGYAKALIDDLKSEHDMIIADNVDSAVVAFWQHLGFEKYAYARGSYVWYAE
jgi:uncharacterized protein GlcG (DUF336 family)